MYVTCKWVDFCSQIAGFFNFFPKCCYADMRVPWDQSFCLFPSFHCRVPITQPRAWHIVWTQKYLLSEWMNEWMVSSKQLNERANSGSASLEYLRISKNILKSARKKMFLSTFSGIVLRPHAFTVNKAVLLPTTKWAYSLAEKRSCIKKWIPEG